MSEETSMWMKRADKQLVREYRDAVFGDSDVALRHAVRHAVQQARGDDE
ncbi:hypothetical protein NDI54_02115 [Haloarcula sp. S1AR25-5A]|uniref:Uncharacterized protein n=2 Tax=Haloarcula terrestris TaxID=2950533 RepID=A0AAE4EVA1_9EURY|nr:hypothetical protein [Haloarcula terrestris]